MKRKISVCVCVRDNIFSTIHIYRIDEYYFKETNTHVKRSLTCDTFIVTNNDEKKKRDVLCVPIYVSVLNDYKCKIGRCIFCVCLIAQIFEITSHTGEEIY